MKLAETGQAGPMLMAGDSVGALGHVNRTQIRTSEKYGSGVRNGRDGVPHTAFACTQLPSRETCSGILQAGRQVLTFPGLRICWCARSWPCGRCCSGPLEMAPRGAVRDCG